MSEDKADERPRGGALFRLLRAIGPGLITGAADDDPSGIATYSQTGAQFGYGQLWTALYQIPILIAVQEACARIGAVTGQGLAATIKRHYSRKVLAGVVLLVLVANTINIGADIGAVVAAARLVVDVPPALLAIAVAVLVVSLEIFVAYKNYAGVLKFLALALLAYPATALMIHEPWKEILKATFVPHIEFSFAFLFLITGVFGTTISPYMFFWEASEEVEEEIRTGVTMDEAGAPKVSAGFLQNLWIDNAIGMVMSEAAQWFIIMTTATVLFAHGVTNIGSAADAAAALEPLVNGFPNAGQLARDIFAIGVVGLGLLAIPVLAGSAAYALSEAMSWSEGLSRRFGEAKAFYGVIAVSTLIGLAMNFVGIDPIKALVFTAVFNGVAAAPLLFMIGLINRDDRILGRWRGGFWSQTLIWIAFGVMALAAVAMLWTLVAPLAGRIA